MQTSTLYDFEAYLVLEGSVFVIPGDETPKVLYTSGNRIKFAFSCPFFSTYTIGWRY